MYRERSCHRYAPNAAQMICIYCMSPHNTGNRVGMTAILHEPFICREPTIDAKEREIDRRAFHFFEWRPGKTKVVRHEARSRIGCDKANIRIQEPETIDRTTHV